MVKQYKQNRAFQNKERKFYPQVSGKCTKTNQEIITKKILKKNMETEGIKQKC